MTASSSNRIGWVDSAKAISIFMIVAGHSADKTGADNILLLLCMFTGVGVFFLLSGMTFCERKVDKEAEFPWFDDRPATEFLKELWHRIIIPYLFWSVVSILIYAAAGKWAAGILHSDRHNFAVGRNLLGMLYANSGTGFMEWNRPLWFLPCLAVVECIWFLILKGLVRVRSRQLRVCLYGLILLFSLVWLVGTAAAGIRLNLPWELETALSVMSYFGIGRIVRHAAPDAHRLPAAKRHSTIAYQRTGALAVLSAVLLVLELLLLSHTEYADFRADRFSNPALLLPDMAIGALAVITAAIGTGNNRILHSIGQKTMAILVMHKFPIMVFKTGIRIADIRPERMIANPYGGAALTIVVDLCIAAASIALCLLAERLLSAVCPQLFGRNGVRV